MDHNKLISEIRRNLLVTTATEFKRTKIAPKLVVYMPKQVFDLLMEAGYRSGLCRSARLTEIIEKQTIIGYPLLVIESGVDNLLTFTVAQICYESPLTLLT